VLDSVWRQFGAMDKWKIRDWTHQHCPECKDPPSDVRPVFGRIESVTLPKIGIVSVGRRLDILCVTECHTVLFNNEHINDQDFVHFGTRASTDEFSDPFEQV